MNELQTSVREHVWKLQEALATLPQTEPDMRHHFADGMYCRQMYIPKGMMAVGKVHKREHFFLVVKGTLRCTTDDGYEDFSAPTLVVVRPGSKRAVFAFDDVICMTFHRTFETDLDAIEREVIEPDETALMDSGNKLKKPALEQKT